MLLLVGRSGGAPSLRIPAAESLQIFDAPRALRAGYINGRASASARVAAYRPATAPRSSRTGRAGGFPAGYREDRGRIADVRLAIPRFGGACDCARAAAPASRLAARPTMHACVIVHSIMLSRPGDRLRSRHGGCRRAPPPRQATRRTPQAPWHVLALQRSTAAGERRGLARIHRASPAAAEHLPDTLDEIR